MFVTFEGIEGSGKSTLQQMLGQALAAMNIPVLLAREPGGTEFGKHLRELLLSEQAWKLTAQAELHLFLADRAQHVEEVIKPALDKGASVLCDRYADSTIAYQFFGRKISPAPSDIKSCDFLRPDITFLLDIEISTALSRLAERNKAQKKSDRFDNASWDFHKRVRHGFLELASLFPERIQILDACNSPVELCRECLTLLEKKGLLPSAPLKSE